MTEQWNPTLYTFSSTVHFSIQPGSTEPVVYDPNAPEPLPYVEWLQWCVSEQRKAAPGRIYAHL